MLLRRTSAGSTPAILLAEAKARLRVTHTAEDDVITAMIASSWEAVGEMAGRVLATETWEMADMAFSGTVKLPKSPVIALTSVQYLDATETLQTATLSDFALIASDDWSLVQPKVDKDWPSPGVQRADAMKITFTAGYTTLPPALREAVLLMIGHRYRNRESVSADALAEVPMALRDLVALHKIGWFGA